MGEPVTFLLIVRTTVDNRARSEKFFLFDCSILVSLALSKWNGRYEKEEHIMTNGSRRDLVVTRLFHAPLSLVWKAWSDPCYVMQWWGPDGFTSPLAQMDFREGATSLVCMSAPEYGDHYSIWRYEKIVPMQRIEYIHNLADKDGKKVDPIKMGIPADFPQDQRHTVTFKDVGNGQTEMTVTEHDWTVGHMMELSKRGLNQCLDKMAAIFIRA